MRDPEMPKRHHHFVDRLLERYGIRLTHAEVTATIAAVAKGQAQTVAIMGDEARVVLLYYGEADVEVQAVFLRTPDNPNGEPGVFKTALAPGTFVRTRKGWVNGASDAARNACEAAKPLYVSALSYRSMRAKATSKLNKQKRAIRAITA